MANRGRPSAASQNVVGLPPPGTVAKLPPPPKALTAEQATVWRGVVASRGGDLISSEAYPVLIEYCRAVTIAAKVATQVDNFDPEWLQEPGGLERWDKLLKMQDRAARAVTSLAGKLRLTPASRILPRGAGRNAAKGEKKSPWEFEGKQPEDSAT